MTDAFFDVSFFKENRERLQTLFTGTAPIVLTASGLLQRNADATFPFRQDSNFWYLTGLNEPDLILVIDKNKEYLIVPGRSGSREAFDGQVDIDNLRKRSGIDEVYDEKNGWKHLENRLKKVHHVATLAAPAAYIESQGFYTNPARRRLIRRLKELNPAIELLDLRTHMVRMRSIKQEQELAAIQHAIALTTAALKKLRRRSLERFAHEYEVEAALTAEFRKANAGHAYTPIVASGQNAVTLHYISNDSPVVANGLLLLDVGAEIMHYAADITRTYAVTEPSKRQVQVWQAVMDVREYALAQLRPGVVMGEYEKQIEQFMGEKLRALGLIKTIDHESVRKYYPHATSHFLGLDVHDVGDYERGLEPGMVLTVEPGIYIPEEGIGIRIEDDVLITADGSRILSDNLPHEL